MVISLRVPDDQAQLYRSYAERSGMSLSDFLRSVVDGYIADAEEQLRKADEQKQRQERIRHLVAQTERFAGFLANSPAAAMTDAQIADLMVGKYA